MQRKPLLLLLLALQTLDGSEIPRIAYVADGNHRDTDDWAGTAMTMAMFAIFDARDCLVHYSHSCDFSRTREFAEAQMDTSLFEGAEMWGQGFDTTGFFNAYREREAAAKHLAAQINASRVDDILWIIEAGEPDLIHDAMRQADTPKRAYVRILTYHPHNDIGTEYDLTDIMALPGVSPQATVRIPDQNIDRFSPAREAWLWMRDHEELRVRWIWERGAIAMNRHFHAPRDDIDYSDAGMLWYVLTGADQGGDPDGTAAKFKAKVEAWLE